MSQDTTKPDPQQFLYQKAANPSLMITEDESKKQKALEAKQRLYQS